MLTVSGVKAMAPDDQDKQILEYATPWRTSRVWRVFWDRLLGFLKKAWDKTPLLALAILLALLAQFADPRELVPDFLWRAQQPISILFFYACLCLPGALKRPSRRHFLLAGGCTVALTILDLVWSGMPTLMLGWYAWTILPAILFVMIATMEWLSQPRAQRCGIKFILSGCIALAFIATVIDVFLHLQSISFPFPIIFGSGYTTMSLDGAVWPVIAAVAIWGTLPWMLQVEWDRNRFMRWIVVGATGVAILLFVGLVNAFVPMARATLHGTRWMAPDYAIFILKRQNDPRDVEPIWQRLFADSSPVADIPYGEDWRKDWIEFCAKRDQAGTANRLAHMLLRKPSRPLTELSADLLAKENHYECVPLLLRYATLRDPSTPFGCCNEALSEMGVPHVVVPIALNALVLGIPVTPRQRHHLTQLLGKDAGPNPYAWLHLYDRVIGRVKSPLPRELHLECTRVIACLMRFYRAWVVARKASIDIAEPNWDVPTTKQLESEVAKYVQQVEARTRPATMKTEVGP